MVEVSNIRKDTRGGGDTRLLVDINISGAEDIFTEKTMWFSVKNENADMLTDETYDAFFLVPLYLAMYFHQDLHIHGKVSKCLYKRGFGHDCG